MSNVTANLPIPHDHLDREDVQRLARSMRPVAKLNGMEYRPSGPSDRFLALLRRMRFHWTTVGPGVVTIVREIHREAVVRVVAALEARAEEIATTGRRARAAELAARAAVLRARLADPFAPGAPEAAAP